MMMDLRGRGYGIIKQVANLPPRTAMVSIDMVRAGIMKKFLYGFLAALVSTLAVCAAWFARKAENATEALRESENKLANEATHNEQAKEARKIQDELDDFDDVYLAERLRGKR